MRKTLILTLVLCAFAVIAYAQPTGTSGTTSGTTTSAAPAPAPAPAATGTGTAAAKPAKHAAHCTYKGTVASVDATAKSFVVHPAKGEDMTLKVNDKTKYTPKTKGWDDVKADAKVSGACHKDGADNWAVSVKFAAEKKMKAEKAPAAPKTGK